MSFLSLWRLRLPAACAAALFLFAASMPLFASEPTGPLTAEPTVPRPATKPCVAALFTDADLITYDLLPFVAPPACPPPWSKVVLEADLSSRIRSNSVANLRIQMTDRSTDAHWILYMGAPQVNAGAPSWRVERDLTDYAALFHSTALNAELDFDWDNVNPGIAADWLHGNVRLLFYPQGIDAPAPRVPDGVFPQNVAQTLPRNIVKAYVEVLAQGLDDGDHDPWLRTGNDRHWYACVPDASIAAYPALRNQFALGDDWGASISSSPLGCNGGSFREAEVWLDDTLFLGIAPIFPWLPSNVHREFRNTVDTPVPSAHALDFIPYRVDITPFAARLNDGIPHRLTVRIVGDTGAVHMRTEGKLFVYRDPKLSVVTGGITRNTLAHARPTVTPVFTSAPDTVSGTIDTYASHKSDVAGYVITSAGRVNSAVHTEATFHEQQSIRVDGLGTFGARRYATLIALDSNVLQGSARMLGATVIERDATVVQSPLRLAFGLSGFLLDNGDGGFDELPSHGTTVADQTRLLFTDQWRGPTHYTTALRDHFAGRHTRDAGPPGGEDIESDWSSQRDYVFLDSLGGCYTAARLTTSGALTGSSTGAGCPGSVNTNAWYTRPDGSPENMGWAP